MRTHLILNLHCSDCGRILRLCYEHEVEKKPINPIFNEHDREPTGADIYKVPIVSVEPCRHCIEKYTIPAKKVVDGIKGLMETGK